ncbi:MAG: hypothetical protein ACEQSB_04935 [Undibacterium sp.]
MESSPSPVFPDSLTTPTVDCPYFTVIVSRWRYQRPNKQGGFAIVYKTIVAAVDRESAIFLGLRLYYLDQLTQYSQPSQCPIGPELLETIDRMSITDALFATALLAERHRSRGKRTLLQVHAAPWKQHHEKIPPLR